MNRTVTQQRNGGRASRALKTLTAIGAAALLCAAPASAAVIDFESQMTTDYNSGATLTEQRMNMELLEGPVGASFGASGLTGSVLNAGGCLITACPANSSGKFLAVLNDGAVRFTNADQVGGFMINAFSLAFVAPLDQPMFNGQVGYLQLSGNVYGGGVVNTTVAFPGQNANTDFMFGSAQIDAAFRQQLFTSVTFSACLFIRNDDDCDNSLDFPGMNQAQFAIDNIDVSQVPEPASFGLLGLGIAALGLARRRRAAKPAVQSATV